MLAANGPCQANMVLIAYASSEGSGEPAHPRSLARTSAARSYKQLVKRNLQTESQIPGPSEWLGMRSNNLSWRNARRHKFAWRGSNNKVADQTTWIWRLVGVFVFFCILHEQVLSWCSTNISHLMTKATQWHVHQAKTQISLGIRPVWSESPLSVWRKLGSLATQWAHSEDSDQTWRMPRLIWVFVGHTVILLVLSWGSSYMHEIMLIIVTYNWWVTTMSSDHEIENQTKTWKFCMD